MKSRLATTAAVLAALALPAPAAPPSRDLPSRSGARAEDGGTWILPSSARAPGVNAFWTTGLTVTNSGGDPATVTLTFLGHTGNGASGPEKTFDVPAWATVTWPDVLASAFGLESDWGPILVRSNVTTLVVHGETSTPSPSGGSYGQVVPALGPSETFDMRWRTLAGLRQDDRFRTNVVLSNLGDTEATVVLQLFRPDGTTELTDARAVPRLGVVQLNLARDLGVAQLAGGSLVLSSPTPGARVAAYASVIDATTSDPRTVLAR